MKFSIGIGIVWFLMVSYAVGAVILRARFSWLSVLLLICIVVWGVQLFFSYRNEAREESEWKEWQHSLHAAVDVRDFEIDERRLYNLLEPAERKRLIQELEQMPHGSRSFRRALEMVAREMVNESA
jgi:hypothetical protein